MNSSSLTSSSRNSICPYGGEDYEETSFICLTPSSHWLSSPIMLSIISEELSVLSAFKLLCCFDKVRTNIHSFYQSIKCWFISSGE